MSRLGAVPSVFPGLRNAAARTLAQALTLSVLTHALLLSWPVSLPLSGGQGLGGEGSRAAKPRPLRVSLALAAEEVPPVAVNPDPPREEQAHAAPEEKAPAASDPAGTENALPLLGYYPAGKLTKMPQAVGLFDVRPPAGGDTGLSGKVTVRIWIGSSGAVDETRVLSSGLPPAYAEAALAAFRNLRFRPGEIGGVPVKSWVEVVIEYADFRDAPQVPGDARE